MNEQQLVVLYTTSKGSLRGLVKGLEHDLISFREKLLASSNLKGLQDLVELIESDIIGCHELTCLLMVGNIDILPLLKA